MNITSENIPALRTLGLHPMLLSRLATLPELPGCQPARIIEMQRDRALLHFGQHSGAARIHPELLHALQAEGDSLAVGDWVLASPAEGDGAWVRARVTPLNTLSRRDPEGRRQTLVANVDTALLVMGLDHDFKLARLDRYLVLTRSAGVDAVVVLSKADLCGAEAAQERAREVRAHLAHSRGASTEVLVVDGTAAATREQLAPWLGPGQTLVLLGSSGAGKSTLTNTLAPGAGQHTSEVRADDSRGRHTTTTRSLHQCESGACIIDTPGLRALQLDASREALEQAFDDVALLAGGCRFRNCSHEEEPGCAVRAALSPARLRSYHKLRREAGREQQTWLERREQLSEWKARARAGHSNIRSKRGDG